MPGILSNSPLHNLQRNPPTFKGNVRSWETATGIKPSSVFGVNNCTVLYRIVRWNSTNRLQTYMITYCVCRAETEGGHANSFQCTEGSIKTTTLFFFPCEHVHERAIRYTLREAMLRMGGGLSAVVRSWKGEQVTTSKCFTREWGWFVFSEACCWHLHTLEFLAEQSRLGLRLPAIN